MTDAHTLLVDHQRKLRPDQPDGWIECDDCQGTGFFYSLGPSGDTHDCSECGGSGGWFDESVAIDRAVHAQPKDLAA